MFSGLYIPCCPTEMQKYKRNDGREGIIVEGSVTGGEMCATFCSQRSLPVHCRIVTVQHVQPGGVPPSVEESDFWYDQEHDRRFLTFTDSLSNPPASREQYKEHAGPRVRCIPWH